MSPPSSGGICEQIMKMIEPTIFLKWDITVLKAIQVITEAERKLLTETLYLERPRFCKTSVKRVVKISIYCKQNE
jgi:gamma-glutamyltranspeptidase